ncbi:MAG: DsbC family protein [Syntrophobacteraceae bacterium]
MKKTLLALVLAVLMFPGFLWADNGLTKVENLPVVKGVFSKKVKVVAVKDMGDIYEIVAQRQNGGKRILYATKDGKYLLLGGNLLDKNKVNLTQLSQEQVDMVDLSTIALQDALKMKKGNGAKMLIMFADVDCPFCRRAYEWLKTQTNYTLYVFFYPLSIHPQSQAHTIGILCSQNPLAALDQVMSGRNFTPLSCRAGAAMLAKQKAVAYRVGVDGTPLFLTDAGTRIVGFQVQKLQTYLKNYPIPVGHQKTGGSLHP